MTYKIIKSFLSCAALLVTIISSQIYAESPFVGMRKFVQEKSDAFWLKERMRLHTQKNTEQTHLLIKLKNISTEKELEQFVENIRIFTQNIPHAFSDELIQKAVFLCTLHELSFFAARIYESLNTIKEALAYWESIQKMTFIQYCLTHAPSRWSEKWHGDLHTAQHIQDAKYYVTQYESYLGEIAALIYQVPINDTALLRHTWITTALQKISLISTYKQTESPDALTNLSNILTNIAECYDTQFSVIKKQIQKEPYLVRTGTKLLLSTIVLGIAAWSFMKNYDAIGNWCIARGESASEAFNHYVYKPIDKIINTIFFRNKAEATIPTEPLDPETIKKTSELLERYHPELSKEDIKNIMQNEDAKKFESIILKTDYGWAPWQTVNDSKLYVLLSKRQYQKIFSDLLDRSQLTQQVALLTPAILVLLGTSYAARVAYQKLTKQDYRRVSMHLKELETLVICSTIEINSDHSLFGRYIAALAHTRKEVVRFISSRYTNRERLFEDLALLESYTLTNEQRYRLIEQLRKSYTIFQTSLE